MRAWVTFLPIPLLPSPCQVLRRSKPPGHAVFCEFLLDGVKAPDLNKIAAGGDQPGAVRRDANAADGAAGGMTEGPEDGAGEGIKEADGLRCERGGDGAGPGGDRDANAGVDITIERALVRNLPANPAGSQVVAGDEIAIACEEGCFVGGEGESACEGGRGNGGISWIVMCLPSR